MRRLLLVSVCSPFLISCSALDEGIGSGSLGKIAGDIASVQNVGKLPSTDVLDVDPALAVGAGADLVKAATVSDEDISKAASEFATYSDSTNKIAGSSSSYGKRLARLTSKHLNEDGLKLNFKVYMSPEVNAFALGNGTIRVYSGLMDMMNDEELLGVIGHEIGHVKLGHSHDKMRSALLVSAARKGVASTNSVAGALATNSVGALAEGFLNAQYSQSKETESDEYGLNFMLKHGYNPRGVIGAMKKLAKLEDEAGGDSKEIKLLSSHPAPGRRAEHLAELLEEKRSEVKVAGAARQDPAESATRTAAAAAQPADTHSHSYHSHSYAGHDASADVNVKSASLPRGIAQPAIRTGGATSSAVYRTTRVPSGYYLQTCSETEIGEAERKAELLRRSGLNVRFQNAVVDGVRYRRVLVGPYASRTAAEGEKHRALQSGAAQYDAFIRFVH